MGDPADSIQSYFSSVDLAFGALERIFETEGIWVKRHNLIYETVKEHIGPLRHAFDCWQLNARFADAFRIDTSDSGFPLFRHVLQLENDHKKIAGKLETLPKPDQIREEMVEHMLKTKKFPRKLQKNMAERLYFSALGKARAFRSHSVCRTVGHFFEKTSRRPCYVVHWSCYDGSHNLPMVYMAVIEDSSPEAPRPPARRKGPWGKPKGEKDYLGPGLPNRDLTEDFQKFITANSQYSLNLTSIATAMDNDFPTLHPKNLRRFILGPLNIGGLTENDPRLDKVLSSVKDIENNWGLTWTLQELDSQDEVDVKGGLWGVSVPREVYYINTDDPDCVQQGVSATARHALIPHEVYQKAYASEEAAKIFSDYQCYIASGEHILRHV
jgi:hypothetical protein